jgi:DNA-binding SARP family transcriptional activator/pimeloyl-ACP methyl ester carboxylesterase
VDFRILGPLEVHDADRALKIGAGKQRALLALLLLNANRTVASERIVDELWGEQVPESASKMVQVYVSQLRKVLPGDVLRTRPPGYVAELEPDQLDLRRFDRLAAAGREALAEGAGERASALLTEALALWRGPALAEFASEPFATPEGARLEELRLAALEDRIEADLACGRSTEVVGELESLIARHPLRESLRRRQMLALYRSGRHAEALAAYQQARRALAEELGLEPSPALRELQRQILSHDPALHATASAAPAPATIPETRYARSGEVAIAHQVAGDGPFDLVLVPGYVSHVELGWTTHPMATILRRLAAASRMVLFDKRGTGMSDRVADVATLETRMDDVRAVMDEARMPRAAVMGISEGAPMSLLFAATHPERVAALVLLGGYARTMWAPDYPWGFTEEQDRLFLTGLERLFGDRSDAIDAMRWFGHYTDEELGAFVDFNRRAASPGAWRALNAMNRGIDVRQVLSTIHVPTLIVHGADDPPIPLGAARYMAQRIPGARLLKLEGELHLPAGPALDEMMDEIVRFLNGVWEAGGWTEAEPERILATVLFCKVADANAFDAPVQLALARFRASARVSVDDGFYASFDGPARAIRCGCAIREALRELGADVRLGLHAGECDLVRGRVEGIAVQTARRIAEGAQAGELVVSSTVKELVAGTDISFTEVAGDGRMFTVELGSAPTAV